LKIYNGTPEGVPLEIQGQQLPINELNGTLLSGACPISNLHRCKPEKAMLFCTFHPSEWEGVNDYIVRISLKKDIELLFMISGFKKHFVYSSLNELSNNRNYLSKLSDKKIRCFVDNLIEENLDGWFSSIENKSQIEVALINNQDFFEAISFENLNRNWRNGNNLNGKINHKNWGNKYEISSLTLPLTFDVNIRYKPIIEEYINYGINSKFPFEYVLQVILNNATIKYHNGEYKKIVWKC